MHCTFGMACILQQAKKSKKGTKFQHISKENILPKLIWNFSNQITIHFKSLYIFNSLCLLQGKWLSDHTYFFCNTFHPMKCDVSLSWLRKYCNKQRRVKKGNEQNLILNTQKAAAHAWFRDITHHLLHTFFVCIPLWHRFQPTK